MDVLIATTALALLMLAAYRGLSVIVMAPLLAMAAVLLTDPAKSPPPSPACSWSASPAS